MNAISDRSRWLAHLRYCTSCPTDLCDRGMELAAAVEATLLPGETWKGVYAPTRPWPAEPGGDYGGV